MASRRHRQRESAPGWAWMLFGLSIGLAVALIVYLQGGRASFLPADQILSSVERSGAEELAPPSEPAASEEQSAGDPDVDDETPFSFYGDLGRSTVVVDDDEFDFGAGDNAPRVVLLQAGAFREIAQADSRRALLALLGFESHIDSAIVEGEFWFRVLIGPLTGRAERNRIERRLASEGIQTVVRSVTN